MMNVPFFRPEISDQAIAEVVDTLRSGWLTSGPKTKQFEVDFAHAVGARHALALNSCTAALHLALEALGVGPGHAVLVPTMTFAASAEVVRYQGAVPILVDCDPVTLNLDLDHAEAQLQRLAAGEFDQQLGADLSVVGIIPVHVGGLMADLDAIQTFAAKHELWIVEDAAHAFPASWRSGPKAPWRRCGEKTAVISCFSFYANKTITTGEGGMAVTDDDNLADRMKVMALHGLSKDAWGRYSGDGSWDYRIVAPGFKYNLTDIASAIGLHQLARAEELRLAREGIAQRYLSEWADLDWLELPPASEDRIHSWHLFPVRLRLDRLTVDRNEMIRRLNAAGVGTSVHWRPLHLHPYYEEAFDWRPDQLPIATTAWPRLITLPLFPAMREEEIEHVIEAIHRVGRDARTSG